MNMSKAKGAEVTSVKPLLEIKNVTMEFKGNPALKDVDFDVMPGEVHALIGENGAGKSTLVKIIAGIYKPTKGEVLLDGKPVNFKTPLDGLKHGISTVYQETSVVPAMTVAQNIYLGEEKFLNRLRGLYIAAQQFLQSMNFDVDPMARTETLGAAKKQMTEIARAVHFNARLIIFDEPTATLTPEEKRHLFGVINRLREKKVSIIYISHALEEALDLSDRITVLRDGAHIITDKTSHFNREKIVEAMVGRSLTSELYGDKLYSRKTRSYGNRVVSIQSVSKGNIVRSNSLSIYAGQITTIFGLVGSGRTETMKILAGVIKRDYFFGGDIYLEGKDARYRVPRPAVKAGIVYIPEDRKKEGFFETMTISENIYMAHLAHTRLSSFIVSMSRAKEISQYWFERTNIKAIDPNAKAIELSGGNQQKLVIAKGLVQKPKLIIFDEPTRGVDVGAIKEIHKFINELADEGIAVVVISSYLPEVLALSDRILVQKQGRVVEEMAIKEATQERIMYAAVH
jgi:ABC-type sugar transport system ATPase subunit